MYYLYNLLYKSALCTSPSTAEYFLEAALKIATKIQQLQRTEISGTLPACKVLLDVSLQKTGKQLKFYINNKIITKMS